MNEIDSDIPTKIKEAETQTKVSLLFTILSFPFGLMAWILKDSSSFAIDVFALAVTAFLFSMPMTIIWYRIWKRRLKNSKEE